MNRRNKPAPRLAVGACGLGGLVWLGTAIGQSLNDQGTPSAPPLAAALITAPSGASITAQAAPVPPTLSWSAANLPGATVYQDNYINGGSLTPDVTKGDLQTDDTHGLARSLELDAVASSLSSRDGGSTQNLEETGFVGKSQWETASYGAWSLDASARAGGAEGPSEQGQGGTLTLRQRGMPFDGGWQADNALGDINTPDIKNQTMLEMI